MSRLDDLPPDQRATLSLLLRRGKSYADVAGMLDIDERAVHARAHAALAVLAAAQARELTAAQREEVGDYLPGQRSGVAERLATRTYLDGSPQARAWATELVRELEPLAGAPLPEIPNGARPARLATGATASDTSAGASAESGTQSATGARRRSARTPRLAAASPARVRGALLLAVIVAGIVVAVVLLTGGGSQSSSGSSGAETSGTGSSGNGGAQKARAKEDKRITLTSPDAASNAFAVAQVLSEGNQYAFYLAAQHLPPSKGKGFFYAVWLYNSPSSFQALSRAPAVGPSGNVQGGALLPKNAAKY